MQNAPVIATELNCQFCGWPLIKNGELVCDRSGHTAKAALGQKRIFCPFCRKPKVTLAKKDRAICPKCGEETPMIKEGTMKGMKVVVGLAMWLVGSAVVALGIMGTDPIELHVFGSYVVGLCLVFAGGVVVGIGLMKKL